MKVELAETPSQQEQGLMYRTDLKGMDGMLFVFEKTRSVAMWMKNTILPLDMVFINEKGIVTHVEHNATPHSTKIIPSGGPVKAVLELAGGRANQLHLKEGSAIRYDIQP